MATTSVPLTQNGSVKLSSKLLPTPHVVRWSPRQLARPISYKLVRLECKERRGPSRRILSDTAETVCVNPKSGRRGLTREHSSHVMQVVCLSPSLCSSPVFIIACATAKAKNVGRCARVRLCQQHSTQIQTLCGKVHWCGCRFAVSPSLPLSLSLMCPIALHVRRFSTSVVRAFIWTNVHLHLPLPLRRQLHPAPQDLHSQMFLNTYRHVSTLSAAC